jgi:hypothetical protein
MGSTKKDADQAWCDDLLLALRLRDVPGARIGEVLAEVQSHVAETGEDPRSAFGPPREYADEVAGALGVRPSRGWLHVVGSSDLLVTLVMGVGGFLLADGLWSLGAGDTSVFGLSAWATAAVGTLLLGSCILSLLATGRQEPDDTVVDPRTGADMVSFGRGRLALLVAAPVVALILMLVGGALTRS